MLDTIFDMLQNWRAANRGQHPRVLHISYRWERALRQAGAEYDGILPIYTPLTVFGMYIQPEYTYGPWAWIEGGRTSAHAGYAEACVAAERELGR